MEHLTYEKKDAPGIKIEMKDLKPGDIFRCTDPTEDQTWVLATGTPAIFHDDVWGIPVEKASE